MPDSEILSPSVHDYLTELASPPDPVLEAMRAHGDRDHIPILNADSARLLMVIARAAGARSVVEVGTAIGVSTLHLARAVGPEGRVISFEIDEHRHNAARDYLTRAGVADRVDLRLVDAGVGLDNALLSGGVASGRPIGHWSQEAVDRMRSINARLVSGEGLTGMVIPTGDGLAISVRS